LIEAGCDVNAQNNDGMTCLLSAMWVEDEDIFKELIFHGADPSISDDEGTVYEQC
jgi:ankyrin repeat protein